LNTIYAQGTYKAKQLQISMHVSYKYRIVFPVTSESKITVFDMRISKEIRSCYVLFVNFQLVKIMLIYSLNVTTGIPCVFGVLTCDDMDQVIYDSITYSNIFSNVL
jgi:hypothetical protein